MKIASYSSEPIFDDRRIAMKVVLETSVSKEIRIAFRKGQIMKEHKSAFPIVVHILSGEIEFGVRDKGYTLTEGSIISLDADEPHDLTATQDSIVRLTISKSDQAERVKNVIQKS